MEIRDPPTPQTHKPHISVKASEPPPSCTSSLSLRQSDSRQHTPAPPHLLLLPVSISPAPPPLPFNLIGVTLLDSSPSWWHHRAVSVCLFCSFFQESVAPPHSSLRSNLLPRPRKTLMCASSSSTSSSLAGLPLLLITISLLPASVWYHMLKFLRPRNLPAFPKQIKAANWFQVKRSEDFPRTDAPDHQRPPPHAASPQNWPETTVKKSRFKPSKSHFKNSPSSDLFS